MNNDHLIHKYENLLSTLRKLQSAVIAFSGGVDSTFLLSAVKDSGINSLAVTGYSETMPKSELDFAKEIAALIGIDHRVIMTDELKNINFTKNSRDRCYHCKDELFSKLGAIADSERFSHVLDGSNVDDIGDWRPGRKAAEKHGVRSLLIEAGLSKAEIRILSKQKDLPTWSKAASPCLSSRFPYGMAITGESLKKVELAEKVLMELGFKEFRVRYHGDIARIEVNCGDFARLIDIKNTIISEFHKVGFRFVSLDLEGFKSGRFNR